MGCLGSEVGALSSSELAYEIWRRLGSGADVEAGALSMSSYETCRRPAMVAGALLVRFVLCSLDAAPLLLFLFLFPIVV